MFSVNETEATETDCYCAVKTATYLHRTHNKAECKVTHSLSLISLTDCDTIYLFVVCSTMLFL
jgi:hypothetical protein